MNKNDLLQKIGRISDNRDRAEEAKNVEKIKKINLLVKRINGLSDQLEDLWETVDALCRVGIDNGMFTTNGIDHNIGFYTRDQNVGSHYDSFVCKPLRLFGVEGGGCMGGNLTINLDTMEISYSGTYGDCHHINYLRDVVRGLDAYEQGLINYIEGMINAKE